MTLRSSRMAALLLSALERAGLCVASTDEAPDASKIEASELPTELLGSEEAPCPRRPLAAIRHVRRRDWTLACYRNGWTPPEK